MAQIDPPLKVKSEVPLDDRYQLGAIHQIVAACGNQSSERDNDIVKR